MATSPRTTPDDLIAVLAGGADPEALVEAVEQAIGEVDPDPEEQRRSDEERANRLRALGLRLKADFDRQAQLRQTIEERWYKDIRQFNGQYEPGTFSADEENTYGSRVFVPLTRRLVTLCESRLVDVLFQSEHRGYAIEPSPVPDMDQASDLADQLPADAQVGGAKVKDLQESIKAVMDEAKSAADGMQREIDDQLAESQWARHARRGIHDALLLGTAVFKGPVPANKRTKRWVLDPATGTHMLVVEDRVVPSARRVDPWNFFPDMSATHINEVEFVFERHFMTKAEVSKLAETMPDVDKGPLMRLLQQEPKVRENNHRERLRSINGPSGAVDARYELYEYHGPIKHSDLVDCGCPDVEEYEDGDEVDPLLTHSACVWFTQDGEVFKAALSPLDEPGTATPYRVFCWQEDESSVFGYGMPYEVRDQQEGANASNRALMDNQGLCARPIVFHNPHLAEPYDGTHDIYPGKTYLAVDKSVKASDALQLMYIESRLEEFMSVFAMNKQLIEEIGTLPAFLQGQDAPSKMQSATEASIAWTAANLWVRRCVRAWDDMFCPMVEDFAQWNMEWSDKEEIKGDHRTRAMGVAYLAELEGQAGRLQQLAKAAQEMGIPLSSQYSMLREYSRALKLDPDRWLPSEAEIRRIKEAEAKNPMPNPEAARLEVERENNKMDHELGMAGLNIKQAELQDRQAERTDRMNLELTQAAQERDITQQAAREKYGFEMAKAQAASADKAADRAHDSQMLNAEMQLRAQTGAGV